MKQNLYQNIVRYAMLYMVKCWVVKNQHANKVIVADITMLCWNYGNTRQNKIRNYNIRKSIELTPIVEKFVENRFRPFRHVERRLVESIIMKEN